MKPCDNCPFRSDRPFHGLSRRRANEIVDGLMKDADFRCHKTVDYKDEDSPDKSKSQLCVGSVKFLEQVRRGGAYANLGVRLEIRYKKFDPSQISDEVPIYWSKRDFVNGASAPYWKD